MPEMSVLKDYKIAPIIVIGAILEKVDYLKKFLFW